MDGDGSAGKIGLVVKVQPLRHEGTKKEYEVCFCHELSRRELKFFHRFCP